METDPWPAFELHFPECGVYRDGAALHQQVPPSRWCVTRADLERFKGSVRQLVAQGLVKPTAHDPFVASDELVGPKIHTVNEQIIKPVTARAGNPSWALMLHPEGLSECELFVTHCWKEGAHEFLDKVLHSWPSRAQIAYCCMLSNPQNLNIGALIGSPRDSPFAHALHASQFVLVVPNMECSIYSRIWCVYEAFLAYQGSKIILTATAPVMGARRHVLGVSLLLLLAFNTTWITCQILQLEMNDENVLTVLQAVAVFSLVISGFVVPGVGALLLICLSTTLSGTNLGLKYVVVTKQALALFQLTPYSMAVEVLLTVGIGVASIIAEAVRLRRLQSSREAAHLRQGYTGKLCDAMSSVAEDKARILEALSNSVRHEEVEEAIQVLLDQGMSTPTLREAGARAGRLRHARNQSASSLLMVSSCWFYLPMKHIGSIVEQHQRAHRLHQGMALSLCDDCAAAKAEAKAGANLPELCASCTLPVLRLPFWISVLGFMEAVAWVYLFRTLPKDKRGFALQACVRIGIVIGGIIIIVFVLVTQTSPAEDHGVNAVIQLGLAPVMLLLSMAGPGLTSRTPVIGPWIVRQLMRPVDMKTGMDAKMPPCTWPCLCLCAVHRAAP